MCCKYKAMNTSLSDSASKLWLTTDRHISCMKSPPEEGKVVPNHKQLLHYPSQHHPIISSVSHSAAVKTNPHLLPLLFHRYQLLCDTVESGLACPVDSWHDNFPHIVKPLCSCQTWVKPQWPTEPIIRLSWPDSRSTQIVKETPNNFKLLTWNVDMFW